MPSRKKESSKKEKKRAEEKKSPKKSARIKKQASMKLALKKQSLKKKKQEKEDDIEIEWKVGDMLAVEPEESDRMFWICKIDKIYPKEPKYLVTWFELNSKETAFYESTGQDKVHSGAIISKAKFKMVAKGRDWLPPDNFFDDIVDLDLDSEKEEEEDDD